MTARAEQRFRAMGTECHIVVRTAPTGDGDRAGQLVERGIERVRALEARAETEAIIPGVLPPPVLPPSDGPGDAVGVGASAEIWAVPSWVQYCALACCDRYQGGEVKLPFRPWAVNMRVLPDVSTRATRMP